MQGIIEEIVRWIGWVALKVLTLGRYRGGEASDAVAEGGVGLGLIVASAIVVAAR